MTTDAPVSFETVRQLALALPEVTEDASYDAPAFRLHKKLLAHLREDGETLVITIEQAEREFWMLTNPSAYFITDHYVGYRKMLIRLVNVPRDELEVLLKQAWRMLAPKRLRERVSV